MNLFPKKIYTIGYSPHTLQSFVEALEKYKISAIADVRSSPYSQFKPEFNRETLKKHLKSCNMSYVFIGDYLGARVDDLSCYVNGKVDYKLVSKTNNFQEGLARILKGMKNYNLAIMCAEKDPITCHRTILIARNLISAGIIVRHIIENADIEDHKDSEKRLMKLFKLDEADLFISEEKRLEDAYARQGKKIAYVMPEDNIK